MDRYGRTAIPGTDRCLEYEKKIRRAAGTWALICRHILLTVLIAVASLAVLVFVHCIPGMTVKPLTLHFETIPYGESFDDYSLKILQTKWRLEFAPVGSEEWSVEYPNDIGEYRVRTVAKRLFGHEKPGKEQRFAIIPCERTVRAAESYLTYGDDPTAMIALIPGDRVVSCEFVFAAWAEQTEVTPVLSSIRIENAFGEDRTCAYQMTAETSEITLGKRVIDLSTASASWEYDGYGHKAESYEIRSGEPAYEDVLYADFPELTDVEKEKNEPTIKFLTRDGEEVTHMYSLKVRAGTLQVTPRRLVIATGSAGKVYDGLALTEESWFFEEGTSLADRDSIFPFFHLGSTAVHAGEYLNTCDFALLFEGCDVKKNYDLTILPGTLTISPRPITFSSSDLQKVYDGNPFVNGSVVIAGGDLGAGDSFSWQFSASAVDFCDVGTALNDFTVKTISGWDGMENLSDYEITMLPGTLTITPRPITVYGASYKKYYDGQPLVAKVDHIDNMISGYRMLLEEQATLTRAGICEASFKVRFTRGSRDITSNFIITYRFGNLEILRHPFTLTVWENSKVYDGIPLVPTQFEAVSTLNGTSLFDWNKVDAILTGSQLYAGTSASGVASFTIWDLNGNDVTDCFEAVALIGSTLTVIPRDVWVITPSLRKTYDGTPLAPSSALTFHDYSLAKGDGYSFTVSGTLTNPGSTKVVAKSIKFYSSDGTDISSSYHICGIEAGILTVDPIQITVRTQNATKTYDGKALTAKYAWISQGRLLPGHTFSYSVTGTQRAVGESANTVSSIRIRDKNGIDVTSRYSIYVEYGTLTVLEAQ